MSDRINVCWLIGGYSQRKNLIDNIVSQVSNPNVIYMPDSATGEEVQRILKESGEGIFGMEDGNKVIILGHLLKFKNTKQPGRLWSKILSECPDNCIVLFNNVNKYDSTSLFKLVKKIGKVFEYENKVDVSDAISMTESFFESEEKKIDSTLNALIVDRLKEEKKIDSDLLHINLQKLILYVGRAKTITKEDIVRAVSKNSKFVIWDWFDLIDKKDYNSLMLEYKDLKQKEKPSEIINSTLPVFRWRFNLMLLVKDYKDRLKDSQKVLSAMKNMKKTTKKDSEEEYAPLYSDFVVRGILYGKPSGHPPVDVFTKGQLITILKLIDGFMLSNRWGKTEEQCDMMMQTLLMFICNKTEPEVIKNLRNYLVD